MRRHVGHDDLPGLRVEAVVDAQATHRIPCVSTILDVPALLSRIHRPDGSVLLEKFGLAPFVLLFVSRLRNASVSGEEGMQQELW